MSKSASASLAVRTVGRSSKAGRYYHGDATADSSRYCATKLMAGSFVSAYAADK